MINITLYNKAISSIGHANYKEIGNDIYCAAISAILQSSLAWFNENDIELEISSGLFKIKLLNDSNDNVSKINLLKLQLESFNQSKFKKYIRITKEGKDYYE